MEVPRRRQHLLGLGEPAEQLVDGRSLHALPEVTRRLPLEARVVGEHSPDRRPRVRGLGEVVSEPVVQLELACIPELHDRDGREGLCDRPDAVLRVGSRRGAGIVVRDADGLTPEKLAVSGDGGTNTREPLFSLDSQDAMPKVADERLRRR